jgi:hypothetical protein
LTVLNALTRCRSFLRAVEAGYEANPYHNATHAADVLQTTHVLLHQGGLIGGYADPLTLLGCYLAAVVHDVQHPGLNNDFLVATHHRLAITYNDRAPLENHHAASGLGLLHQPDTACLSGLSRSQLSSLRKLVRVAGRTGVGKLPRCVASSAGVQTKRSCIQHLCPLAVPSCHARRLRPTA